VLIWQHKIMCLVLNTNILYLRLSDSVISGWSWGLLVASRGVVASLEDYITHTLQQHSNLQFKVSKILKYQFITFQAYIIRKH